MIKSSFESGYSASRLTWREAIDCWQRSIRQSVSSPREAGPWSMSEAPDEQEQEALVSALERRLNLKLPPSYRDFLAVSDGRVRRRTVLPKPPFLFLSAAKVDWFRSAMTQAAEIWRKGGDADLSDENYLLYDLRQYGFSYKPEFIDKLLLVGNRGESAQLLLNPEVRTRDGEWEAWILSSSIPGAVRFPSFAHMARDLILADEIASKDEAPYPASMHRERCSAAIRVNPVF
jgi:hypothetical protein